jgi:hypothetical protein
MGGAKKKRNGNSNSQSTANNQQGTLQQQQQQQKQKQHQPLQQQPLQQQQQQQQQEDIQYQAGTTRTILLNFIHKIEYTNMYYTQRGLNNKRPTIVSFLGPTKPLPSYD